MIRKLKKKNPFKHYLKFYVNGTSHSQGGGLESLAQREDSVETLYKNQYPTLIQSWPRQQDLTFAARLQERIQLELGFDNEAESGGGVQRTIRMTYRWLARHQQIRDKIFLILEIADPLRQEAYYAPNQEYYIINTSDHTGCLELQYATRKYFSTDKKRSREDRDLQQFWKDYVKNHINLLEEAQNNDCATLGLYAFCKLHGVKIFLQQHHGSPLFDPALDQTDVIYFGKQTGDIAQWAKDNHCTITQELHEARFDEHPGYFGHIKYAEQLELFLRERL